MFARKRLTVTRLEIASALARRARADSCIIHQCRMLQDAAWLRQCASRVCRIDTALMLGVAAKGNPRVILYACHILLSADSCEGAHPITECRIRANKHSKEPRGATRLRRVLQYRSVQDTQFFAIADRVTFRLQKVPGRVSVSVPI